MTDSRYRSGSYEGAAGRLLEREPPEGYRVEWTRHIAEEKTLNAAESRSCLVFRIGDSFLALPTSLVEVVAEDSAFHTIPQRRNGVPATLANVRGELVICIALSALLDLEASVDDSSASRRIYRRLISCRWHDQRFAFPVDEICGVEQYRVDEIGDVPATLG